MCEKLYCELGSAWLCSVLKFNRGLWRMQKGGKPQADRMNRHLSPAQLRRIGTALYGDKVGWQSRVSEALGVSRGAVTRWMSGATRILTPASLALQYMLRDPRSRSDLSSETRSA